MRWLIVLHPLKSNATRQAAENAKGFMGKTDREVKRRFLRPQAAGPSRSTWGRGSAPLGSSAGPLKNLRNVFARRPDGSGDEPLAAHRRQADLDFAALFFWIVIIATAATMIAAATRVRELMGSWCKSQPRKTATTGLT